MRAAVLTSLPADHLEVRRLPDPTPGSGDVLLRVEACGICGTDVHILEGTSYRPELPFVLGHEVVGQVAAVGTGVAPQWIGQRMAVAIFEGCGVCKWCQADDERLCPRLRSILGVTGRPGGFAEYVTAPVRNLITIPDGLGPEVAASLVDAGATAANAARRILETSAVGPILVAGGGPIGMLLAALLRDAGCDVLVAEPSHDRRRALSDAGFETTSDIASAAMGRELAVVADCAGAPGVVPAAVEALMPGGMLVAVGYITTPELPFSSLARKEIRVVGIRSGRREDLRGILASVAGGRIPAPDIETWELDSINDALGVTRAKGIAGKAVIEIENRR